MTSDVFSNLNDSMILLQIDCNWELLWLCRIIIRTDFEIIGGFSDIRSQFIIDCPCATFIVKYVQNHSNFKQIIWKITSKFQEKKKCISARMLCMPFPRIHNKASLLGMDSFTESALHHWREKWGTYFKISLYFANKLFCSHTYFHILLWNKQLSS